MSYLVNRYNGTFLVSVADGTIDSTTDIKLVGKNYAGYGQVQNENFLHLLESFAGSSQPVKPISGQIWFDTTDRKIKVYDGIRFRLVGGATSSSAAPTGLSAGEFWFDSIAQQLYCYTGSEFTLIGPQNPSTLGDSTVLTQVVKDSTGTNQSIARLQSGGTTMAIISKSTFDLNSALNPIAGFSTIRKGITLVDTLNEDGITSDASGAHIWGTASSAHGLVDSVGGFYSVDQLVKANNPQFSSAVNFSNNGLTIGNQNNLSISLNNGTDVVFQHQTGDSMVFNIRVSTVETRNVANLTRNGIFPGENVTYSLGSESRRWYQLFAENISGNLIGNVTGDIIGTHTGNVLASDQSIIIDYVSKTVIASEIQGKFIGDLAGNAASATNALKLNDLSSSTQAIGATVVIRDSSANITANRFIGLADKADRIRIDNSAVDTDTYYRSAKTTKTANTIAARDSAGNLSANIFNGTATAVQGADVAEKYLADQEYAPGTVLIIGGEKEVTACSWVGQRAIGVVSTQPGVIMNEELEGGTLVALKGRVPCMVIGAVKKGQRLVAANDGCATAVESPNPDVFAMALEENLNTTAKIIEVLVL